jgi:NAD(P)-dependent dehydrogenase (short-subunit alcohol dehydrogenase family)
MGGKMDNVLLFYGPLDEVSQPLLRQFEAQGITVVSIESQGLDTQLPEIIRDVFADKTFSTLLIYPGFSKQGEFLSSSSAEWQETIDTIEVMIYVFNGAAERLVALGGGGHILLLSHVAALTPFHGLSRLGTTLAALKALTKMLALELAPHRITIHGVAIGPELPGLTDTSVQRLRDDTPFATHSEQATVDFCHFLCTEAGQRLSGQTLALDGGFLLTRGSGLSPYLDVTDV